MKRTAFPIAFLLLLSACQQVDTKVPAVTGPQEPHLHITAAPLTPVTEALKVDVTLTHGPVNAAVPVHLTAVNGMALTTPDLVIHTDDQGQGSVQVSTRITNEAAVRTALSVHAATNDVSTAILYFNIEGNGVKPVTQEQVTAAYPVTFGRNLGSANAGVKPTKVMLQSLGKADLNAPLPPVSEVRDVQYVKPDGTLSELYSGLQYSVLNTGGGQPSADDLDPSKSASALRAQYACGTQQITVRFTVNGTNNPVLPGTYVRASEQNTFADSISYEGFIGNNGEFTFPMQICDTGNWFAPDAPDIYFIVEARNKDNVRMVYGSSRSVHWFRTETWWNSSPAAMNGKSINLVSPTADSANAWRVWERINTVYEWHAQAMAGDYQKLPLNVLFPANDFYGVVGASRAAFGEIQLLGQDYNSDHTIFHEFGHEAYYMNVLGSAQYLYFMPSGYMSSGTFPICTDCMSHSYTSSKGEQYGMIEGWADFFEAVAYRNIPPYAGNQNYITQTIESPDTSVFGVIPAGAGNEIRVAAYLYDLYDISSENKDYSGFSWDDGDAISPSGSGQARYRDVARYTFGGSTDWGLTSYWFNKIKPTLTQAAIAQHCAILIRNKLSLSEPACAQ